MAICLSDGGWGHGHFDGAQGPHLSPAAWTRVGSNMDSGPDRMTLRNNVFSIFNVYMCRALPQQVCIILNMIRIQS